MLTHLIVAPNMWNEDGLKYRRHRLADLLLSYENTANVIWLYPSTAGNHNHVYDIDGKKLRCIGVYDYRHLFRFSKVYGRLPVFDALEKELDGTEGKKVLWYTYPAFPFLADQLPWESVVYDCSDLWGESWGRKNILKKIKGGWTRRCIIHSEKEIVLHSRALFTTSQYLKEHIKAISGREPMVIENGVDFDRFQNTRGDPGLLRHIPGPRLGFVGGMKAKIDFSLLIELSRSCPEYSIVLIGPLPETVPDDLGRLLERPNVYSTGGVQPEDVPKYMKSLHIGLLPYKKIKYNQAVSPLKLFEYLSVGLPAVGTGLPMTRKYEEEGIYSYVDSDPEQFTRECKKMLEDHGDGIVQKRIDCAKHHDWNKKFRQMTDIAIHHS